MFDQLTKRPLRISTDATTGPYVFVQGDQLRDVEEVLQRADVVFSTEVAIQSDSLPPTHLVRLREADVGRAQIALDDAAVKVSANLVDGGLLEYFQPQSLIERYDLLRSEGYQGNDLVHELLTDDWGAPPSVVGLEGQRSDGTTFRVSIPYESRSNRKG